MFKLLNFVVACFCLVSCNNDKVEWNHRAEIKDARFIDDTTVVTLQFDYDEAVVDNGWSPEGKMRNFQYRIFQYDINSSRVKTVFAGNISSEHPASHLLNVSDTIVLFTDNEATWVINISTGKNRKIEKYLVTTSATGRLFWGRYAYLFSNDSKQNCLYDLQFDTVVVTDIDNPFYIDVSRHEYISVKNGILCSTNWMSSVIDTLGSLSDRNVWGMNIEVRSTLVFYLHKTLGYVAQPLVDFVRNSGNPVSLPQVGKTYDVSADYEKLIIMRNNSLTTAIVDIKGETLSELKLQ